MFRDVGEAGILGIKSIFFDSNQGTKTFENVSPDYRVSQFDDVLKGLPPLVISEQDIDDFVTALDDVIAKAGRPTRIAGMALRAARAR